MVLGRYLRTQMRRSCSKSIHGGVENRLLRFRRLHRTAHRANELRRVPLLPSLALQRWSAGKYCGTALRGGATWGALGLATLPGNGGLVDVT